MGLFPLPVIEFTLVNSPAGVYHSPYLPGVQRLSLLTVSLLNKKSRLAPRFLSKRRCDQSARLNQRADALGAQHLANLAPVFIDADRLQVWAEGPGCGLLRPGTVATKSCLFSTMRTCSHNSTSFARDPYLKPGRQRRNPIAARKSAGQVYHKNDSTTSKFQANFTPLPLDRG